MIGLREAKEIIRRADPIGVPDLYSEIHTSAVNEKGWVPIGEDHYFHESANQIAGPNNDTGSRILVKLETGELNRNTKMESYRDIELEWDGHSEYR